MQRGPFAGRSKATASTLCQKCLKRDIYECTVSAQERPYKSRPSRTQQLLNPKLKPKLTTEVPTDLLRKKGVADELLAKKEEERGRKPSRDGEQASRKRSRSVSSYSSDSVSTISTNRSPSRSPSPKRRIQNGKASMRSGRDEDSFRKRGRSTSSDAGSSRHSYDRNIRRRMSSFSPAARGRRGRSGSSRMDTSNDYDTKERDSRRRFSRSPSYSRRRGRARSRSRNRNLQTKQATRKFSVSRSRSRSSGRMDTSDERNPQRNGAGRASHSARYSSPSQSQSRGRRRMSRSRSGSPFRGARSPVPYSGRRSSRSPSPFRPRGPPRGGPRDGRVNQHEERRPEPERRPPLQRERSLSPYSKRVAMTRAMQGGR